MSEKLMYVSCGRLLNKGAAVKIQAYFMNKYASQIRALGLKLALFVLLLGLPALAGAQQYFTDTTAGDVNVGFRKTGSHQEAYELVVYAGNISSYLAMTAGTTTNITYYTNQLKTMCPDGFGNLQWSVFSSFNTANPTLTINGDAWPENSSWYTVPRTNVAVQTIAPGRLTFTTGGTLNDQIIGVSGGALAVSQFLASSTQQGNTNANNDFQLVLEPTADANDDDELTFFIGDSQGLGSSFGDFGGGALSYSVENLASNTPSAPFFTSPVVSDFYVNVPLHDGRHADIDPITGLGTGSADYLGYFTFFTNGVLSFTRALPAPSAGSFTASATNGFGPLTVEFTNSASGNITNWVWNFGNGTIITNTTGGVVTNVYATAGSYNVTLTVYGPGGSSSVNVANFVVASATPTISFTSSNGNAVISGTNCPAGVQYRILTSTNLLTPVAIWTPVSTNKFGSDTTFSYSSAIGGTNTFFIMVSP